MGLIHERPTRHRRGDGVILMIRAVGLSTLCKCKMSVSVPQSPEPLTGPDGGGDPFVMTEILMSPVPTSGPRHLILGEWLQSLASLSPLET